MASMVGGAAVTRLPSGPDRSVRTLPSPVGGRWVEMSSAGSSRGPHVIELRYDPLDHRPAPDARRRRPADEFPGFRQTVRSPVAGTVVDAHHSARDHTVRARRLPAVIEGIDAWWRDLVGGVRLYGNHVVIESDDGDFLLLGHLQRGSVTVPVGMRVEVGDVVGRCGNSGRTREPRVRIQLMDRRHPGSAHGLPLVLDGVAMPRDAMVPAGSSEDELRVPDGLGGTGRLASERVGGREVLGVLDAVDPDREDEGRGVRATSTNEVRSPLDDGALEVPERMVTSGGRERDAEA
jgi:hypothetical protein